MVHHLLLSLALTLGQPALPAEVPPEPPRPAPSTPPDRWPLMLALQGTYPGWLLDGNKTQVYGWLDSTFTASSAAHNQLPMGFNYLANQAAVQQGWLRVERPVDQSATTPTFGFRADTLVGIDYRFTIARGLFDRQLTANDGAPSTYGIDPVQFYGEAYLPQIGRGLDVKVGRFFAQFGVESIDTTQNPFVSRSYTFIYNPFTHTGVLTTLKLDDAWSVQNGLVAGCDVFLDPASSPTYIGSVKWAPPNGPTSLLVSVIVGNGRFNQAEAFHNPQVFDFVLTHKLSERLTATLEGLYGFTSNVPGIGFANWYGLVQYLNCTLTPRLAAVARVEVFDDVQGQRTGFEGLYTALTVGANYKPNKYVTVRPEVRYDYNGDSRPFEGRHGALTAAIDVILRW